MHNQTMQTTSNTEADGGSAEAMTTDVLIVGLGPVGAALAHLLGTYGVNVVAIDQTTEIFPKPRAIALDHEALRILQMVGVKEGEISTIGIPQVQYHSPMFGRFARVNSAVVVDGHPSLVTFYQPELEAVLRSKLAQSPTVLTRLGVRLDSFTDNDSQVVANLVDMEGRRTTVRARFMVGADGANSIVRRALGLEFPGASFQQDWLIVDARRVPNPVDHCEFICDPRRPTPHMPAPGDRQRWEFMLMPGETRELMETPENVYKLLAPWCDGSRIDIERTAVYRFHARQARAFSKGNCFLVGDAAHITPPFAGQGLVAGLRDVANLAWKLAAVVQHHAHPVVLASYDEERRPHARKIINLARFLGSVVMPRNRMMAFLMHGALRLAQLLPGGRALFEDMKIKPPNIFDRGLFVREWKDRLQAGASFPQAWVRPPSGTPMLSDDALGAGWSLVGFGVDPMPHVPPALLAKWLRMKGRVWQWKHRAQAQHLAPADRQLEALDNTHFDKVPFGWVALVRPDRCVFAEGPLEDVAVLIQNALSRMLADGQELPGNVLQASFPSTEGTTL